MWCLVSSVRAWWWYCSSVDSGGDFFCFPAVFPRNDEQSGLTAVGTQARCCNSATYHAVGMGVSAAAVIDVRFCALLAGLRCAVTYGACTVAVSL
jgi:hypothetical protein